jgi:hypothetical protein
MSSREFRDGRESETEALTIVSDDEGRKLRRYAGVSLQPKS